MAAMELEPTRIFFGLSLLLTLLSVPAVRWRPSPGSVWNWLPWHYLCLTGLAGMMVFGSHWLSLLHDQAR